MYLRVRTCINYIFHVLLNNYTWRFNNHSKFNMTFYSSLPVPIFSVHLENTNSMPLTARVKNLEIILDVPDSSLLYVQFIRKSCRTGIQPLITSPLFPSSFKPPSSLVWIITIIFWLVCLFLFSFQWCAQSSRQRDPVKRQFHIQCVFLPYSETTKALHLIQSKSQTSYNMTYKTLHDLSSLILSPPTVGTPHSFCSRQISFFAVLNMQSISSLDLCTCFLCLWNVLAPIFSISFKS